VLEQSAHPYLFAAVEGFPMLKCGSAGAQLRGVWRPGAARQRIVQQPVSPARVRNSMGAIFRLPVVESLDLTETLRELRTAVFAASPRIRS